LTTTCHCTTNPNPHEHSYLRPLTVAALVNRPFQTVDSWRKRGDLASVSGGYGQTKVCVCCAAQLSQTTAVRWVKRTRRHVRGLPRRRAA
jgi:hypothetical protein